MRRSGQREKGREKRNNGIVSEMRIVKKKRWVRRTKAELSLGTDNYLPKGLIIYSSGYLQEKCI